LLKQPAVTGIAVLALGLGLGLTTTMFSIVYAAVIRGLPFEQPRQLMHVERARPSENQLSLEVPVHDFADWRARQKSFEDLAAFYAGTVNVRGNEGKPERFSGAFITANAFPLLRVQPALGRTFREDENRPDAPLVLLLSDAAWRNHFGGDLNAVGQTVHVNGEVGTVIGVMPAGFACPMREEVWVPLRMDPLRIDRRQPGLTLEVFGRLRNGVSRDQAAAELAAIAQRLEQEYPETNRGITTVMKPYTDEFIGDEAAAVLWAMLGAVFGVLLIACANVANLLLARAAARSKEIAVRTALGASRLRVIVQLLTESLVLAAAGALVGLGVAQLGVVLFNRSIADTNPPFWIDIKIDPGVLLFVLAITLASSLLAGLVPAFRASGGNISDVLKDEARGTSSFRLGRFSKGLVIAEIALSCGLLVPAGLMIKSVVQLKTTEFDFAKRDVFTARVGLFDAVYPDSVSRLRFYEELLRRLEGRPGVLAASLTSNLPVTGSPRGRFALEGRAYATERDYPMARRVVIAPRFFDTFGVSLLQGRDFGPEDRAGSLPVAIVNRSFAETFFPNQDPVGRRIRDPLARRDLGGTDQQAGPWLTIIGVAPDVWMQSIDDVDAAGFYLPLAQLDQRFISIAIRTRGNPLDLTSMVRDDVMAIDSDLPIYFVNSMEDVIEQSGWFYRVFGGLFMVFGFVALFLASVGLYAVMAFSVRRRTQEVGVRMALGAERRDVLRLILRQGMTQLAAGSFLGLGLAWWLARTLRTILFQVDPSDPLTFTAILASLVLTGLLATIVPARRATRVDPALALRYE
jgi:predicted permease